jgi:hypothetical protein
MSRKALSVCRLLGACVCLASVPGVPLFAQETTEVVHSDTKATQAHGSADFSPAAQGVAGLHSWVASDYFDSKEAILACDAIYGKDQRKLALMIENGLDVNVQKKDGITLLHWAVACNSFECFKILLEAGADPDVSLTSSLWTKREPGFETPIFYGRDTILHSCARRRLDKYFLEALKFCQDLDLPGAGGERLTNIACSMDGEALLLAAVLAAGASPNFADSSQSGYIGALIIGDYKTIRVLLDYHADPLYGDFSSERVLKMIDERIQKHTEVQNTFKLGVLQELRQAVIKRAEQLKAEKPPGSESQAPKGRVD